MSHFPDYAQLANLPLLEGLYKNYRADPASVDSSWRHFFEGVDCAKILYERPVEAGSAPSELRIFLLIHAYRCYGHLRASINPLEEPENRVPELDLERLGFAQTELDVSFPTLGFCGKREAPLREIVEGVKEVYSSRIGFEYMNLGHPEMERWIQERIEPNLVIHRSIEEKHFLLEYLNRSEVLETFLHTRYVGQTRFSLEGNETVIPALAAMMQTGAGLGVKEFWIGMAHRGRLNVLANILNKPYSVLFGEFEDDTALSLYGNDDVKYHMGFSGEMVVPGGKVVVNIPPNPSHLESVDPVILGQVRSLQELRGDEEGKEVVAILIHGDAALSGQGVVYESLQLMHPSGYSVGGALHLVINNQIGYTTLPKEGRSTRYCTDIAKTFGIPVFHVNAEDPESCLFVACLAMEIRHKFRCDVFVDLIGYRKYGHNEGDEPSYTQPLQYRQIRSKKTIRELYLHHLVGEGFAEKVLAETLEAEFKETLRKALSQAQGKENEKKSSLLHDLFQPQSTGVELPVLQEVIQGFCTVPSSFHLHPKLQKWLQERLGCLAADQTMPSVDWATAECLAFGSLLVQQVPIRLAGEDVQRGTFSQRHVVWTDFENGSTYSSLCHLREGQGRFSAVNSPLTEYAGLGFEYGYSCGLFNGLVLWEAQYGDFDNGAQIVIDQYIASAEQKWSTGSSIVLLLPHAYEGAGPEHSSGRMERFLQLAAFDNMRIVNASTPAQYFHLLRRQILSQEKKPLILFTPKSLLRASACKSPVNLFISGHFQEVLNDPTPPASCKKVILCAGKIYYDLIEERAKNPQCPIAIIRLEQLYPLHTDLLQKMLAQYQGFSECCWVQEEPQNMGAWSFLFPYLQKLLPKGVSLSYIGRSASATPATGSHKRHKQEQNQLIQDALKGAS
ncbi:MAG: 2-oxoglutarate dehydrogenase E1 component [Chlamydiia bacterium]|nr:2-oxoglutarate dehydrogenase E1 component [Chlamydiia bacterium]